MEDLPPLPVAKWKRIKGGNGPWPKPRHGHRAVAIRDLMIVFGGSVEGIVNELYVFNTENELWYKPTVRGELPHPLASFGMCCDGVRIYLFGGMIDPTSYSNELYELDARRWEYRQLRARPSRQTNNMPAPRFAHSFNIDANGYCYVFGGFKFDQQTDVEPQTLGDFWRIKIDTSPTASNWEELRLPAGPSPRESHAAVIEERDHVKQLILYGGMNGERLSDIWICDLNALVWRRVEQHGVAPLGRSLHTATLIGERLFVFGGWVPLAADADKAREPAEQPSTPPMHSRPHWRCSNDLACFNVRTCTWQSFAEGIVDENEQMPRARAGHSAVVINNRVYIWSGRDGLRKMKNAQVCCKDMYALETAPPTAPGHLQLVRASLDGVEIQWLPSPTADAYLLQTRKVLTSEAEGTNTSNVTTPNVQRALTAPNAAAASPSTLNGSPLKYVPASAGSVPLASHAAPNDSTITPDAKNAGSTPTAETALLSAAISPEKAPVGYTPTPAPGYNATSSTSTSQLMPMNILDEAFNDTDGESGANGGGASESQTSAPSIGAATLPPATTPLAQDTAVPAAVATSAVETPATQTAALSTTPLSPALATLPAEATHATLTAPPLLPTAQEGAEASSELVATSTADSANAPATPVAQSSLASPQQPHAHDATQPSTVLPLKEQVWHEVGVCK